MYLKISFKIVLPMYNIINKYSIQILSFYDLDFIIYYKANKIKLIIIILSVNIAVFPLFLSSFPYQNKTQT